MNTLVGIDMGEVTRLTKAGQLAEATALLRQGFGTARAHDGRWQPSPDAARPRPVHLAALPAARPTNVTETPFRYTPRDRDGPAVDHARPTPPGGGRFETKSYANAAGSRRYKLYVPSGYRGDPVPLVVMLHGCTQSPDDFAAGTRMNALAEEFLCLVAYPEQTKAANASKCWNWFNAAEQKRGSGEPSLIAGLTREIMRDFAVDPDRVFVAGLSAGGAAAAIMASQYPDLYAAACVHSGLACGAAKDLPSAFAAMRNGGPVRFGAPSSRSIPMIIFHGSADKTVHPANAGRLAAQVTEIAGSTPSVEHGRSAGGLEFSKTVWRDASGCSVLERWDVRGGGHTWFGGSPAGSYTDPRGPDASREMMRFFLQAQRA